MSAMLFVNGDLVTQLLGHIVRQVGSTVVLALADSTAHVAKITGVRLSSVDAGNSGFIAASLPGTKVRCEAEPTVGNELWLSATNAGNAAIAAPAIPILLGFCYAKNQDGGVWFAEVIPSLLGGAPSTNNSGKLEEVLSMNFITMPDQNLRVDGAHVIGGKSFSVINAASTAIGMFGIINGAGIVIQAIQNGVGSTMPVLSSKFTDLDPSLDAGLNEEIWLWYNWRANQPGVDSWGWSGVGYQRHGSVYGDAKYWWLSDTFYWNQTQKDSRLMWSQGSYFTGIGGEASIKVYAYAQTRDVTVFRITKSSLETYVGYMVGNNFPSRESLIHISTYYYMGANAGYNQPLTDSLVPAQWAIQMNDAKYGSATPTHYLAVKRLKIEARRM